MERIPTVEDLKEIAFSELREAQAKASVAKNELEVLNTRNTELSQENIALEETIRLNKEQIKSFDNKKEAYRLNTELEIKEIQEKKDLEQKDLDIITEKKKSISLEVDSLSDLIEKATIKLNNMNNQVEQTNKLSGEYTTILNQSISSVAEAVISINSMKRDLEDKNNQKEIELVKREKDLERETELVRIKEQSIQNLIKRSQEKKLKA